MNTTRVLTYTTVLFAFVFFFQGNFTSWIEVIPESAWTPVGITNWFHPIFLILKSPTLAWLNYLISGLFTLSTLSCILKWRWPLTSIVTLALSSIIFGLKNSFGHAYRAESVLIIAQLILTLRATSILNTDQTLLALRTFWVSIFFLSGLNKLFNSGLNWVTDNYVLDYIKANQITRAGILSERPLSELAQYLMSHPFITKIFGFLIFSFELLYPFILLKKIRLVMVSSTIIFQLFVFVLLGVNFFFYLPLLPIWFANKQDNVSYPP